MWTITSKKSATIQLVWARPSVECGWMPCSLRSCRESPLDRPQWLAGSAGDHEIVGDVGELPERPGRPHLPAFFVFQEVAEQRELLNPPRSPCRPSVAKPTSGFCGADRLRTGFRMLFGRFLLRESGMGAGFAGGGRGQVAKGVRAGGRVGAVEIQDGHVRWSPAGLHRGSVRIRTWSCRRRFGPQHHKVIAGLPWFHGDQVDTPFRWERRGNPARKS